MSPAWRTAKWLASVMVAGIAFAPFVAVAIFIIRADNGWLSDTAGIVAFLLGDDVARAVQTRIARQRETPT